MSYADKGRGNGRVQFPLALHHARRLEVLTGELRDEAAAIVAKYPNPRSAALPLLFFVQSIEGHLTEAGMRDVAQILNLTPAEILGTASFYTMLKKRPTGDYLVSVCRNVSCTHRGARSVISALEEHLGISAGETTTDGKLTLEAAECLATCDGAPSAQVNYEDFYDLTPESAKKLVDSLRRGDEVRSVRGDVVKSHREISRETARAGVRDDRGGRGGEDASVRLVGGEAPPPDFLPGFRPKVSGEGQDDG